MSTAPDHNHVLACGRTAAYLADLDRQARTSASGRAVLMAVALIGLPSTLPDIAAVAGMAPSTAESYLREWQAVDRVRRHDGGIGRPYTSRLANISVAQRYLWELAPDQ